VLKGKAKTDYQREYMRKRRSNKLDPVRPTVRPNIPGLVKGKDGLYHLEKPVKSLKVLPFCEYCQVKHEYGEHIKEPPELDADGHIMPAY